MLPYRVHERNARLANAGLTYQQHGEPISLGHCQQKKTKATM